MSDGANAPTIFFFVRLMVGDGLSTHIKGTPIGPAHVAESLLLCFGLLKNLNSRNCPATRVGTVEAAC
jgi:hypothetical protein